MEVVIFVLFEVLMWYMFDVRVNVIFLELFLFNGYSCVFKVVEVLVMVEGLFVWYFGMCFFVAYSLEDGIVYVCFGYIYKGFYVMILFGLYSMVFIDVFLEG